ncbi:MAG: ribonuclease HI [Candidatus Comchoanobacterales bacterium]
MIELYTDGACRGNPGIGGWGCLILSGKQRFEGYGFEPNTTNNRMEIMAVIQGLTYLMKTSQVGTHVTVYSDSNYVIKAMSEWRFGWAKKSWRNAQNKPVKNKDMWIELIDLADKFTVTWRWVKGHSGHEYNEHVDQLANRAIDERETHKWL